LLKPDHSKIDFRFLAILLGSERILTQARAVATGTAQLTIPLRALREFEFEAPTLEKQRRIATRVESLLSYADEFEAKVTVARARIVSLIESVLATAFRGELVRHDPNDKPAVVETREVASIPVSRRRERLGATSLMRVAKERSTMTKSRMDEDVKGHPYLRDCLRSLSGAGSIEALFQQADLAVADFYKQLAWEIDHSFIKEAGPTLEAIDEA
jgi:type I restriction enzyme S subunit